MDTDSSNLEKNHFDKLKRAGYVGEKSREGVNIYEIGGFFYSALSAPKVKQCRGINDFGVRAGWKTFEVIEDDTKVLDRKKTFRHEKWHNCLTKVSLKVEKVSFKWSYNTNKNNNL